MSSQETDHVSPTEVKKSFNVLHQTTISARNGLEWPASSGF
jgi:hypothetical protein